MGPDDEEETKSVQSNPSDTTAASERPVSRSVEPSQDELIKVETMRLGFQNIGPTVTNLELFTDVETILLPGNLIVAIAADSFRTNLNLQFLSLARNKLESISNLKHLVSLQFLDLSNNQIEAVPDMNELPVNLLSLKFIGNPIEQRAMDCGELAAYRKPFVLHLTEL